MKLLNLLSAIRLGGLAPKISLGARQLKMKPLVACMLGCILALFIPSNTSAKRNVENLDPEKALLPKADENPYSYLYGSVAETNLIRDHKGQYATNIAFQPRYTSAMFIQSVLFCGNQSEIFGSFAGPLVVTYKRLPHELVQGVPCFELVRIDRVESNSSAQAQRAD